MSNKDRAVVLSEALIPHFRGWPGERYLGWSGDEEQVDMLYVKKRVRWFQ
jgi:hypothetical protein